MPRSSTSSPICRRRSRSRASGLETSVKRPSFSPGRGKEKGRAGKTGGKPKPGEALRTKNLFRCNAARDGMPRALQPCSKLHHVPDAGAVGMSPVVSAPLLQVPVEHVRLGGFAFPGADDSSLRRRHGAALGLHGCAFGRPHAGFIHAAAASSTRMRHLVRWLPRPPTGLWDLDRSARAFPHCPGWHFGDGFWASRGDAMPSKRKATSAHGAIVECRPSRAWPCTIRA